MNDGRQNREMFNNIAPHYDFLNHLLSLNIDRTWRRTTAKEVAATRPDTILDIATGTADLAIVMAERIGCATITGIDTAENMLTIGLEKTAKHKLSDRIKLTLGDALDMPFADNSFDAATCAFGVRNFSDTQKGLEEMFRVLSHDGTAFILEFSLPQKAPFKQTYNLYFNKILPKIGKLFSKDEAAYDFLPQSVNAFPTPDMFAEMLKKAGFATIRQKKMSLGIATLHIATKESD